jgi:hypothetical protein
MAYNLEPIDLKQMLTLRLEGYSNSKIVGLSRITIKWLFRVVYDL